MPCFLKMPALSPTCDTAVSQLPRWPMASFKVSWAAACEALSAANAAAQTSADAVLMTSSSFLLSDALDGIEPAQPSDDGVGADGEHEQHDQHGVHARHVEQAVGLDDQKADAAVRQFGFGQQSCDQGYAEAEPD